MTPQELIKVREQILEIATKLENQGISTMVFASVINDIDEEIVAIESTL